MPEFATLAEEKQYYEQVATEEEFLQWYKNKITQNTKSHL